MCARFQLWVVVFALASHLGCDEGAPDDSWFPLDMGNEWHYRGGGEIKSATYRVGEKTTNFGMEYTAITVTTEFGARQWRDVEIRADEEGRIIRWAHDRPTMWFDVTADNNATYSYQTDYLGESVEHITTVRRNQTVQIDSIVYTDCITFYMETPVEYDSEHWFTIAEDVGIVAMGDVWYSVKLADYNIQQDH